MENNLKARKKKDNLLVSLVYLSAIITVGLLVVIVGFIFIKGIAKISPNFLFADYSDIRKVFYADKALSKSVPYIHIEFLCKYLFCSKYY